MTALVKSLTSEPSFDISATTSSKLEMATARRFCILYYRLRFQNPKMSVHQICEQIGISPRTMLHYRQKLGEHKHTSNRTTEEKIDSAAKALVTKQRNAEKKKFLTELGRNNLSAVETQKWLDAWDREHAGIGSTPVSGTPSEARQQQRQRRKVRGGRPPEPADSGAVRELNTDANESAVVRGGRLASLIDGASNEVSAANAANSTVDAESETQIASGWKRPSYLQ